MKTLPTAKPRYPTGTLVTEALTGRTGRVVASERVSETYRYTLDIGLKWPRVCFEDDLTLCPDEGLAIAVKQKLGKV